MRSAAWPVVGRDFSRARLAAEVRLGEIWRRHDSDLFAGRLYRHQPALIFGEPALPYAYATYLRRSDDTPLLVVDERLILGRLPGLNAAGPAEGRWRFISDVLLHEMIHSAVSTAYRSRGEQVGLADGEHGHEPTSPFAALAELIGRRAGLPEPARNRWWCWPYTCRDPAHYLGAVSVDFRTASPSIPLT